MTAWMRLFVFSDGKTLGLLGKKPPVNLKLWAIMHHTACLSSPESDSMIFRSGDS